MDVSTTTAATYGEVHEELLTVGHRLTRAFVGGSGKPLLLVHGGWGGASLHWRPVLRPLAEHFRVIAPDLPGVGDPTERGLGSVGAYARWLCNLLDALEVRSAWCAGNSFGASVVCRFALDFPDRCLGLVLVNGFPLPRTPRLLRLLGERPIGRRLVRAVERQVAYRPRSLQRAFFDPDKVPIELRALVRQPSPAPVAALADVLIEGGGASGTYPVMPLFLWGEEDHLPGTSKRAARKLSAAWRGSRLALVPRAGHLPQVENPGAFVDALVSFAGRVSRRSTSA